MLNRIRRETTPLPRRPDPLFLVFLGAILTACATTTKTPRPTIPKGPQVTAIRVEGNHAFTDSEITGVIAAEATSHILFWEKKYLDSGELEADQARVANFYRLHGYFDVVVAPIQVVPYKKVFVLRKEPAAPPEKRSLDAPIPGPDLDPLLEGRNSADVSPQSGTQVDLDVAVSVDSSEGRDVGGWTGPTTPGQSALPSQVRGGSVPAVPPARGTHPNGPRRVALIIEVDEGSRYRVREVRLDLRSRPQRSFGRLESLPHVGAAPSRYSQRRLAAEQEHVRQLVTSAIRLREGAPFDGNAQRADEAAIEQALKQASYAWATVSSEIILLPRSAGVRIRYHVVTGPPCFFGRVRVEGLDQVDQKIVRLRIRKHLAPGSPYRQATLVALQNALYDLQLFQSVTVLPDEASRNKPVVDVVVTVREKAFRQIRVGGGLKQETNWQEIAAHTSWTNKYFSHRLIRFSLDALAGWGFSPGFQSSKAYNDATCTDTGCSSEGRNGPILNLGTDILLPDFKGRRVTAGVSARFRVGQTVSYGYLSPKLELTASRQLNRHLAAAFASGLEQYLPTPDAASQAAFSSANLEGTDNDTIRFEGTLTYLQQSLSYDRRDHILAPERGVYLALVTQEAGLFGDFSFLKAVPDARVYVPIIPGRLIVGARYSTGVIVPVGGKSAPPVLYFQLGGGSTVRGIPWNSLTYYTGVGCASPVPTPDSDAGCTVATGGTIFHLANLEVRVPLGEVGVVVFGDAGHVALVSDHVLNAWATPSLSDFLVSVGLGARYKTPVGPVRLDFGYRVHEPVPLAPGLAIVAGGCRCGIHLAIGEAF